MAVEIKSGASSDIATVDVTSKAVRVTNYNSAGTEVTYLPVSLSVVSVVAANENIISQDVSEYVSIALQLTAPVAWVGVTVTFQGSNDDSAWYSLSASPSTPNASHTATATAIGLFIIPVVFKYFRVRVTGYTSGTVSGVAFGLRDFVSTANVGGQIALGESTAEIGKLGAGSATIGVVSLATTSNANRVVGEVAHDAVISGNPVGIGGVASAAAPTAVTGGDAVRVWCLLNGAQAAVLTAAGALIGGDATNGLDVDITRMSALVAGTNTIMIGGVNIAQINAITPLMGAGTSGTGSLRTNVSSGATATLATVATSTTSATLLAAAVLRMGFSIWNDSLEVLYITFGTAATSTNATIKVAADGRYEATATHIYNGAIHGILGSGTGNARVTSWAA